MKFDVVIIGGGLAGMRAATVLQTEGLRCAVVAEGLSLHDAPRSEFKAAGGTILAGDKVVGGVFEGDRLKSVRTEKLGDVTLEADWFILATGKYFSKGIVADMDRIYEPLFGLDVFHDPDRTRWYDLDFFAPQAYGRFGVETDRHFRALKDGKVIDNLYVAGSVLAHCDAQQLGCGGGVAIISWISECAPQMAAP